MLEAEGRSAKRSLFQLSWSLFLVAGAGVFILGGGGLILWSFYQYLLNALGFIYALFLTGLSSLLVGLALGLIGRRFSR